MSFSPGDVLLAPVVFSDGSDHKRRPVVIICDEGDADLLVAPVTSQAARSPHDVPVIHWQGAGLRLPSVARLSKLATVEKSGSQENGRTRAG
ncbi:MAG: type II toxin-antitoxin system PemK/MazF family toxin [Limisphaerales bacterium]